MPAKILQVMVLVAVFAASAWAGHALFGGDGDAPAAPPATTVDGTAPPAGTGAGRTPSALDALSGDAATVGDTDSGGAAAPVADVTAPTRLTFEDITQWDLDPENVQVPASVRLHHGKRVDIIGYMIPYGDPEKVTEFLLVRDLGSCCFGAMPQPHHMIEGAVSGGKSVKYAPGPVRVRGTFKVAVHREGKYLVSVFAMDVEEAIEVR